MKDSTKLLVQEIKQINLRDALEFYGVKFDSRGAAQCPLHQEKTASFRLYKSGKRWHCFGCNADGDLIQFVTTMFGLTFIDAVKTIAADFNLRQDMPVGKEQRERLRRIQDDRAALQADKERIEQNYWDANKRWIDADRAVSDVPVADRTTDNEAYVDAIFKRMAAEQRLDTAQSELYRINHLKHKEG